MKLFLGVLFALTSAQSFASTAECSIEGFAKKSHRNQSVYRFLNQVEVSTEQDCEVKLDRAIEQIQRCMMVPAGEVTHVQMTFNGKTTVRSVWASCGQNNF